MSVLTVGDALERVLARRAANGIRIVGVDGPSGSGKSTVARRLAAACAAPVIECDDFVSWDSFAGWWPRFEHEVLDRLVSGADARHQTRDWQGDLLGSSLEGFKTVRWAPLVIIDGVTSTRAAAGQRVCFRIWVDAPEALRLRRGIERDGEDRREAWPRWMAEERIFFEEDGTRDRADLIVDGAPAEQSDAHSETALTTL